MKKLKKGKIVMTITVGLAFFILVAVMFMQFKIVNETDITSIETMRKTELTTELATWKQKYKEVNDKYEETTEKLEEYKNSEQSTEESKRIFQSELDKINMTLGKTDVEGEGIEITLKESNVNEIGNISADDLLIIVNALKLAGAEAISINDQRIINTTDIVYITNSFIKVNQQRILPPYEIKAIGNQSHLESGLIGNGGYVEDLIKLGHDVKIEKNSKVTINKYEGENEIKYMK